MKKNKFIKKTALVKSDSKIKAKLLYLQIKGYKYNSMSIELKAESINIIKNNSLYFQGKFRIFDLILTAEILINTG